MNEDRHSRLQRHERLQRRPGQPEQPEQPEQSNRPDDHESDAHGGAPRARWTRRLLLKTAAFGLVGLGGGGIPPFLTDVVARAEAAGRLPRRRKTLVTIFQRGAMDGLAAVTPQRDAGLEKLRPGLLTADSEAGAHLPLDGQFGLHPAFAALHPLFDEQRLAIVHGAGSPNSTRSHFDAQDYMESGTPFRKGTDSGWLNRAAGQLDGDGTDFRSVAITSRMPRALAGPEAALAIEDLTQFRLLGRRQLPLGGTTANGFESLYAETSMDLLRGTSRDSFDAMEVVRKLDASRYSPRAGAEYPETKLGRALKQIALLIKNDVGLEIAFAESDGWDTHVRQQRPFGARGRDLAGSIAAFWHDLGDRQQDVVLMTMTEFGRTVHENGSGGTDHGRASCLFVLGDHVRGGRVLGSVPTLKEENLEDGRDLPVTTDFREVFAGVAGAHLQIRRDEDLFPGWDGKRMDLLG